ncbi:MAG: hypothetical protein IKU42_05890 [Oscillospiraceae bacterium]|jgi:hypothetical protein|nr:hypothetical protein [Oscillospiraceae bacterium]
MKRKLEDMDPERPYDGWVQLIDSWIFNQEDRKLLKRHYLDGVPYGDLSEEFCLDVDTIKKRIYKASEKLFRHL